MTQVYKIISNSDDLERCQHNFEIGTLVTLCDDDGSVEPMFIEVGAVLKQHVHWLDVMEVSQ